MRVASLLIAVLAAVATAATAAAEPPARLSDTGFAAERARRLSFEPQYPLWTDGAAKRRWISLPQGAAIDASDAEAWVFPAGTKLWKEFSFGGRRVETRYMEKLADGGWLYATYVWLPDQHDALLASVDGTSVTVAGPAGRHAIPSVDECRACHEGRQTPVLGFSALQLSSDRDPNAPHAQPSRPGDVNLATLAARGLVRGLPASLLATPPRIAAATPTARAALGYLHGNCGGCHNAEGPLASLGLVLAQPAGGRGIDAVLASTVGRPSRFRDAAHPEATLRIASGRPHASVLALRVRSRDAALQMPPVGSLVVDEQAIALIERWITQDLAARPELAAPSNKEKQ